MIREKSDDILQHPSILGISRRRRLYAAFVLATAILLVLLICLSLSVKDFRSVQSLSISHRNGPLASAGKSSDQTREQILNIVRNATSEQQLRQVVIEWTNRLNLIQTGGMLNPDQVDYEKLRARLTFAIEQAPNLDRAILHLGYIGRGNQAEQAFLELFAGVVERELASVGTPSKELVSSLRKRAEQASVAERAVLEQIDVINQHLARVESSISKLKEYPWDQFTEAEPEVRKEPEWVDPRIALEESKVSELSDKREALLQQFPESHPEVLAVRRELEQARLKMLELQENGPKRISNQFVQASFPKASGGNVNLESLARLKSSIAEIEILPLVNQLDKLQLDLDLAIRELRASNLALCDAMNTEPAYQVALSKQEVTATGALNRNGLLLAALASLFLGFVVASQFDVWSFDRGFESSRAVSQSLNVPVFGWGSGDSGFAAKRSEVTASSRILKLSEILVFTTLLVVAGMFLIDPEYRQAVLDNPLHAFARLLWLWKS